VKKPALAVLLIGCISCTHAPSCKQSAPTETSTDTAERELSGPTLHEEELRLLARSNPDAALKMLNEAHPDAAYPAGLQEIAALAHTARFNKALQALEGEEDPRRAIGKAIELANTPLPKNKGRLAKPMWRILGQLEGALKRDPHFSQAAAQRLQSREKILRILGPEFEKRIAALSKSAEATIMRERSEKLIKTLSFDKVLRTLFEWSKRPDKITASALKVARETLISSLEARQSSGSDAGARLREDALMLFEHEGLQMLIEEEHDRLEAIIRATGSAKMDTWLRAIKRATKQPIKASRLACEAFKFAKIKSESELLQGASAQINASLEAEGRKGAMRYLSAIETRDFKTWRSLETPFLGASSNEAAAFAGTREDWLAASPALDPKGAPLRITQTKLDICKASLSLALTRGKEGAPTEVELTMCWHPEGRAWFPCRPLTSTAKGGIDKQ